MGTYKETFKQYDRTTGQWVTRSIERNMTHKNTHTKVKMRQIKKEEPFVKSIFEA